jgi:hypothetical protein
VRVVQELSNHDKTLCLQFCNEFQGLLLQNPNVIHQMIMSDEANFHLCGAVNKQNICYWSETQQMHETPLNSPKVVAWCGITSFGIYSPYFFEDETGMAVTVDAECDEAMLGNFLAPQLPAQ